MSRFTKTITQDRATALLKRGHKERGSNRCYVGLCDVYEAFGLKEESHKRAFLKDPYSFGVIEIKKAETTEYNAGPVYIFSLEALQIKAGQKQAGGESYSTSYFNKELNAELNATIRAGKKAGNAEKEKERKEFETFCDKEFGTFKYPTDACAYEGKIEEKQRDIKR